MRKTKGFSTNLLTVKTILLSWVLSLIIKSKSFLLASRQFVRYSVRIVQSTIWNYVAYHKPFTPTCVFFKLWLSFLLLLININHDQFNGNFTTTSIWIVIIFCELFIIFAFVNIICICFKVSVKAAGMKFNISKKTNRLRDRSRPENHNHRRKLFSEISYLQYWIG